MDGTESPLNGKGEAAGEPAASLSVVGGAVVAAAVFAVAFPVAVPGSKLGSGEGNPGEHLAGILGAAAGGFAAFLGRNGVLHYRDHQLSVPFQADDGELAQCDEESFPVAGENKFLIK